MSVVIIGGHDRMVRQYKEICENHKYKAKVFTQMKTGLDKLIGRPDLLILFTNTVSHKMVGDVSWVVPTAQVYTSCYAAGTALHSWQAVAQGKSSIAHKGMLAAAKVMAYVGAELLLNPELIERAKADWKEELDGETYPNPLPADLKPSIW